MFHRIHGCVGNRSDLAALFNAIDLPVKDLPLTIICEGNKVPGDYLRRVLSYGAFRYSNEKLRTASEADPDQEYDGHASVISYWMLSFGFISITTMISSCYGIVRTCPGLIRFGFPPITLLFALYSALQSADPVIFLAIALRQSPDFTV